MYVALYIFLAFTIIGNLCRMYSWGTNFHASDNMRFLGVCWYVGCLVYAVMLITAFTCR